MTQASATALLLPVGGLELSVEEVRQLWSFVHGDIMYRAMRQSLQASLGLCPRHAWGHAVVEIELWEGGAGARAGHQPFDVAILHEDLLASAAEQLRRPARWLLPERSRVPVPSGPCPLCRELLDPLLSGLRLGYANSTSGALTVEANRLAFTRAWCRETLPLWMDSVCEECLGGIGGDPARMCRRHLAIKGPLPREAGRAAAENLLDIRHRLVRLIASMTDRGPAASPAEDASWIEAVGWFAGWGLPIFLAGESRPD